MTGAASISGHSGFQSELLAQYVFSSWGTVSATPNLQDHGIDLHCTLTEAVGKRLWARDPYTVQVKSNMRPWSLKGARSVQWLIDHPLPLFLCVVVKSKHQVRVYQTTPRFNYWCFGGDHDRLILRPTTNEKGHPGEWTSPTEHSLSAPIIDLHVSDLLDDKLMEKARATLEWWVKCEKHNLDLYRAGLMQFQLPGEYSPNEAPTNSSTQIQSITRPNDEQIERVIKSLVEALDCLSAQMFARDDLSSATRARLLHDHLRKKVENLIKFPYSAAPLMPFYASLNAAMGLARQGRFSHAGMDRLQKMVEDAIAGNTEN